MRFAPAVLLAVLCCAAARGQTATITTTSTGYLANGGTMTFDVTVTYSTAPTALGITIGNVPVGWTFVGVSGRNVPQISTESGTTGRFEFAYTTIPASPVTFSFSALYPAALSGNQIFSNCVAIVRPTNPNFPIADIVVGPAVTSGPPPAAPTIVTPPAGASVDAGQSVTFTVTAAGAAPLTYQWRKDGTAINGATAASFTIASTSTASAGAYAVDVINTGGTVTSSAALLVIRTPVTAPIVTLQPASVTVNPGQNVSLNVGVSGTAPVGYQWRKDGAAIAGATAASLALSNVTASAAGTYSVVVSNAAGSVTSSPAMVIVTAAPPPNTPPQIVTPPAAQTRAAGETAAFAVIATGTAPLLYQWNKDGTAIAGATAAALTLSAVTTAAAGNYTVTITNAAGTIVSAPVQLTVTTPPPAARGISGGYFGSFNGGGSFALLVRPGGGADFLAHTREVYLMARGVAVAADGRFRFSAVPLGTTVRSGSDGRVAAAEPEYVIDGAISALGALTGGISALNTTMSAEPPTVSGPTTGSMGFYVAGVPGRSATSEAIVGAAGDIFLLTQIDGAVDAGRGRLDDIGGVELTTEKNARVAGAIAASFSTISLTVTPPSPGSALTFLGADNSARSTVEKLVNISSRSVTSTAGSGLIAGFVINGEQPKPVLVRAIGPALTGFGVTGALPAAHVEIFRGSTLVAAGDDWGRVADAATVAATAASVGAFALSSGSRDAALLLTLTPGAYTAIVTGQGGASGVSLLEVYDASDRAAPSAQRIVNISTRANAGSGDATLIAGFVISGVLPKRVLVRGIGPTLAAFGLSGVLIRPRVAVYSGDTLLAQNSGWSTSTDANLIEQATSEVGAFLLPANSSDAALVINLAPGSYTAQVSGIGDASGLALVEIYELP